LAVTGIDLSGATVRDLTNNDADLSGAITNPSGVLIIDTTAPTLTLVADQAVHATGPNGAAVTFAATATDLVDGTDPVVFKDGNIVVHSGDIFGLGTHTITASATDAAGNIASESFSIKIVDAPPVVAALTDSVGEDGPSFSQNLLSGATDADLGDQLAISALDTTVTTAGGRSLAFGTDYTLSGSTLALTAAGFAKFSTLAASQTDQAVFHYDVSDGVVATANMLTLTINGADDAPAFTSTANFTVAENSTPSGTLGAVDPEHDAFVFARAGGSDQAFFAVDAHTGALRFVNSPDFETPEDANHDNVYDLVVSATDSFGASNTQTIHVSVTDIAEIGQTIKGGNGRNNIKGTTGNDTITGGNDNDRLDGGDGNDNISGGNGNDILIGGRGNDILDGGNGNDMIDGGGGNNQLFGGSGNDTFAFGPGFGKNVIADFQHGDHLEFDGVLVNYQAVQAAMDQVGADTVISLGADHIVTLQHVSASSLHASDFLFGPL
jgi:VCBS repeat-containing protein